MLHCITIYGVGVDGDCVRPDTCPVINQVQFLLRFSLVNVALFDLNDMQFSAVLGKVFM